MVLISSVRPSLILVVVKCLSPGVQSVATLVCEHVVSYGFRYLPLGLRTDMNILLAMALALADAHIVSSHGREYVVSYGISLGSHYRLDWLVTTAIFLDNML